MQTTDIKFFDTDKPISADIPAIGTAKRNPSVFGLQCPKCDSELVLRFDRRLKQDIHECASCGFWED